MKYFVTFGKENCQNTAEMECPTYQDMEDFRDWWEAEPGNWTAFRIVWNEVAKERN